MISVKKLKIIFWIIILGVAVFFSVKFGKDFLEKRRIEEIKKGWYIEIVNDFIYIRSEPNRESKKLGKVNEGEIYKVSDFENKNGNIWYYIEYEKNEWGWVANPIDENYLNEVNDKADIRKPTLKFKEDVYYVDSLDDINYDHLEVSDDKPGVKVTSKVYHEVNEEQNKDQYWILYIATDSSGKTTKKVQKIEFNKRPSESDVYDFSQLAEDRKN